jgi:Tat protein secretion system quality control protein TatD with DNase activity
MVGARQLPASALVEVPAAPAFVELHSAVLATQASHALHLKLHFFAVLQVGLAVEFKRPVSVHCVKGYGRLLTYFTALGKTPGSCPPKVMLHSYGGSVEEIPRFCKIPNIGSRFYFSFSHAINHRTPEKLRARVAAVPDDRLLLESDQVGCVRSYSCVM